MEILYRGKPPSEKTCEATCRNCGTQIRFAAHEATYFPDQRDGDFLSIGCPVCQVPITVGV